MRTLVRLARGHGKAAVEKAVYMAYTLRLWHLASRSGVATTASLR